MVTGWYPCKAAVLARVRVDAGVGKDRAGIAGLVYLEAIGMAAAAVDCMSARIGDGRSMWESGMISHMNSLATQMGVACGMRVREFVAALTSGR